MSVRDLTFTIPDSVKPTLSLPIKGGFTSGVPGKGQEKFGVDAKDPASGLAKITADLDGEEVASALPFCQKAKTDKTYPVFRPCGVEYQKSLSFDTRDFDDGAYQLEICARDLQGNESCLIRNVVIANTDLGEIEIYAELDNDVVYLYWDYFDGVTFSCSIDESPWVECQDGEYAFEVGNKNDYLFQLKAVDENGKEFISSRTLDIEALSAPVELLPPAIYVERYGSSIYVNWDSTTNDEAYECKLDGGTWADCSDGEFVVPVPINPKVFTFSVRVTDIWGQQVTSLIYFDQNGNEVEG